jgi:hypothetical protein
MLPNQWVGDVYFALALQSLGGVAPRVYREFLSAPAQKSNAPPISDTHKKVEIKGQRFGAGEDSATTPVLITEFNQVPSAADDLAQFFTIKQHVAWGLLRCMLSR